MYSWGGSISGWKGKGTYDYGSARGRYDKMAASVKGPRTYKGGREPDMSLVDPRGKTIRSDSKNPIIIAVDVTGSMAEWPAEIFDRLPLLYQTLSKYREDVEIAFAAIGDAFSDRFPLQVADFAKGPDLEKRLNALGCEGGGGGQIMESYELFGHFLLNHCETPNANSPFLLIYGDEKFYPEVDSRQVEHFIGDTEMKETKSKDVWKGLMQKFNLFYLQKHYGHDDPSITSDVKDCWGEAISLQRIIDLPFTVPTEDGAGMPGYQRAVDIGMGLIAKHWGQYDDFGKNLDARHDDKDVKATVHHSLRFVDASPGTKSVMPSKSRSRAGSTKA